MSWCPQLADLISVSVGITGDDISFHALRLTQTFMLNKVYDSH